MNLASSRKTCLRAALTAVALVTVPATSVAQPVEDVALRPGTQGDTELVQRILEETDAASAPGGAGMAAYLEDVAEAALHFIQRLLGSVVGEGAGLLSATVWLARIAVAFALGLLFFFALRRLSQLRRRRGQPPPSDLSESEGASEARRSSADASHWRGELQRLLVAGSVPEALEALWWWLARSLGQAEVDPSWTSGELVRRCERRDLLPLVHSLDAYQYGPSLPTSHQVETLVFDLEQALK